MEASTEECSLLPTEILGEIMEKLEAAGLKKTLLEIALASRSYFAIGEKLLFRTIWVTPGNAVAVERVSRARKGMFSDFANAFAWRGEFGDFHVSSSALGALMPAWELLWALKPLRLTGLDHGGSNAVIETLFQGQHGPTLPVVDLSEPSAMDLFERLLHYRRKAHFPGHDLLKTPEQIMNYMADVGNKRIIDLLIVRRPKYTPQELEHPQILLENIKGYLKTLKDPHVATDSLILELAYMLRTVKYPLGLAKVGRIVVREIDAGGPGQRELWSGLPNVTIVD
ncbi:hypothetical protein DFJ74DRAFT_714216 [Hyaloraphidium curvatum]|nr:hypothetical protein DFJ74DRAFT_714216 [Hyaloraphidium curvatum]